MSQVEKVVLVTGASSGIGQAAANEFAKLGYRVAITGRNEARLNKVLESLVALSPSKSVKNFLAIQADFDVQTQMDQVVEKTVAKFARLDVLLNNAGNAGQRRDLSQPDFYQDFQRIIHVNLMAPARISQLALPHLMKTKGVIVNVSSVLDRMAMPNVSYSVSKAGVTMLTKTFANAMDGRGVRVVAVAPGPIRTNFAQGMETYGYMTNMNRVGEADEVANVIAFLSSDKASFIHGSVVDVDGGTLIKFGGLFQRIREQQQQQPK